MPNAYVSAYSEANEQFKTAMELKSSGQWDASLTWFRRAAITDPQFIGAHLEIGRLCRDKAKFDRMFLRYAFEAFRTAARLDLTLQEAHDQYITSAQQMGLLDNIHMEYEALIKKHPENELLQRCYKNIVAISMAMITTQANVGEVKASSTMKKFVFAISFLTVFLGLALIFGPPLFGGNKKLTKQQISSFFKVGLVMCVTGVGGIVANTRLD